MRFAPAFIALLVAVGAFVGAARAEPIDFHLPAQRADHAIDAFSQQAGVDVLFAYDDLQRVWSKPVVGRHEPGAALRLLLRGTGFVARRNGRSQWVVTRAAPFPGSIRGRLLAPDGAPGQGGRVVLSPSGVGTDTDEEGDFTFPRVPPGRYDLIASAPAAQTLRIRHINVAPGSVIVLPSRQLKGADVPTQLESFVVHGRAQRWQLDHSDAELTRRVAGGNLDLARTESDALPYLIFNRAEITRSGVVNLNEFLQRELVDSDPTTLPPEQFPTGNLVGSNNLSLRGFSDQETVILVDGRPLPRVMIAGETKYQAPDVNFIPLSLVQQIEVLPVSASALYSGSAVGGVINIVLRPDVDLDSTEVTATYTNAFGHFDAPQDSLSILHTQTLAGGAVRVRLDASFSRTVPATEAELGFRQRRTRVPLELDVPIFGATPNVRTIRPDLLPLAPGFADNGAGADPPSAPGTDPAPPPLPSLFGTGTPPVTSVAPGADGSGGLTAFAGREGVRNSAFFNSPGAYSTGLDSLDFPYGRKQRRATYYGSVIYDPWSWLELAADGTYSQTVIHRGYDVMQADLRLPATSRFNPFGQDVQVALNETAPRLGESYDESRLEFGSLVLSALLKLPRDWRITFDSQFAHNIVKQRGLIGASLDHWQQLVDAGMYNPLRDTQMFGPPPAYYDQVLIYAGGKGRFVTLGNYETLDLALRVTNEKLRLPTGTGSVNVGADYERDHLGRYVDEERFGDGSLAAVPQQWAGRTLARYSFFGELQGPVYPEPRLPPWLRRADADLALRYVASADTRESNIAPTLGMKLGIPGGLLLRGSLTYSNRFPSPQMSWLLLAPGGGDNTSSANRELIYDPVRNEQPYAVDVYEAVNPDLRPESAVTQTVGLVLERGRVQRFRAAIDYADTRKVNELVFLGAQDVVNGEALWPDRVVRAPLAPGDNHAAGPIKSVVTSTANLASRRSQDWTASLDYRWNPFLGGALEAYARMLWFQRYTVRPLAGAKPVDELNAPDGILPLLKFRTNFGASWSNQRGGFGVDGHYYHSRLLPRSEWAAQGRSYIRPYWQFDAFVQADLGRWLPWDSSRHGLRAQFRINNVFGTPFPKYVNDEYGTGVQPYGDWRGRVYSVSVTATF